MTELERTQVLVAGGGPVGLFAAVCAAKRGLDVVVMERNFRGTPRGHTTLLHPSSIRLLGELGLSPLLLRSGQLLDHIELCVGSETRRLDLPFPALALTQALFEETLLQVLHKEEVDLRATSDVRSLVSTEQNVTVEAVRREQLHRDSASDQQHWALTDSSSIQAEFVIGADGRSSRVRQSLDIRVSNGPKECYAMFEFASDLPPEPRLTFANGVASLLIPLHERRVRASFQLGCGARATADLALLSRLLRERAPQQRPPQELHWSGIIDFEHSLAESFGRDRVWLAGDAAHTTSPLGVQSMNFGLTEVFRLIETMSAVEAGRKPLAELERVSFTMREEWRQTLAHDSRLELSTSSPRWLSSCVHELVTALPASGSDRAALLGQLGIVDRSP